MRPLGAHFGSAVAHDRGDPLLVTWILWWSTHAVPLTDAWWNAPAFYPSQGVLAFSENLLGLAPITAPIIALTQAPLVGYNAAFLLSYLLSGLGAYLLAFVLTRRHDASFVAALAFAFAPYRLSHTQHLQLLSSYWMPVAIAALHLYLAHPKWRWAALFAGSWLLQALACGYYLFFLSILVLVWLACFAPRRLAPRDAARLAAAWGVAAVAIAPVLLGYRAIHAAYGFNGARRSAELQRGHRRTVVRPTRLAGLALAAWRRRVESEQFPGITVLILFVAGAWWACASGSPFRLKAEATGRRTPRGTGAAIWVLRADSRPDAGRCHSVRGLRSCATSRSLGPCLADEPSGIQRHARARPAVDGGGPLPWRRGRPRHFTD